MAKSGDHTGVAFPPPFWGILSVMRFIDSYLAAAMRIMRMGE
jgi:hypothetical protein